MTLVKSPDRSRHLPNTVKGVRDSSPLLLPTLFDQWPLHYSLNTPSCSTQVIWASGHWSFLCLESLILDLCSVCSLISFRSLLKCHLLQEGFLDHSVLGSSLPDQLLPEGEFQGDGDFVHCFPSMENIAQHRVDVNIHLCNSQGMEAT